MSRYQNEDPETFIKSLSDRPANPQIHALITDARQYADFNQYDEWSYAASWDCLSSALPARGEWCKMAMRPGYARAVRHLSLHGESGCRGAQGREILQASLPAWGEWCEARAGTACL